MKNAQTATKIMRDWSKSKYGPPVRLTEDSHAWIRKNKKKKSMAGFLEEIISKHRHEQAKNETI